MTVQRDIVEARNLLERAEREQDPELRAHAIEEALILLESCTADEVTVGERTLISNIRNAHTRRLLSQLPALMAVSFDIWFSYFQILVKLRTEVDALTKTDGELRENHERFIRLWRQELLAALGVRNAP